MRTLRRSLRRMANFLLRRHDEERLREEIAEHIARQTEENLRAGLSPAEARRHALLKFGSVEATKEDCRAERGLVFLETLLQDVRFALRILRKSPGFAAIAILTLALGIGANTAIFSAVYGIMLEPPPYAHLSRLAVIRHRQIAWGISPEELRQIEQCPAFERVAPMGGGGEKIVLSGAVPERRSAVQVSADFFGILGVKPLLGRPILPQDVQPGRDRVAVLSYRMWMDMFGGDTRILGREILIAGNGSSTAKSGARSGGEPSRKPGNKTGDEAQGKSEDASGDKPYTVIGVMPRGFDLGAVWGSERSEGFWTPFVPSPSDTAPEREPHSLVALLRPGVTRGQAAADLKVISDRFASTYPSDPNDPHHTATSLALGVLSTDLDLSFDRGMRSSLRILLGAVGFLLLLACVNLSALLLARAFTRQRELAVRRTLGATRWRIFRQLLSESLLLAACGGVSGLLFSRWGMGVLRAIAPPGTPRVDRIVVSGPVLWFTLGISLLAALLFGLAPALQASSRRVGGTLPDGMMGTFAGAAGGRHRLRSALIVVEVALAVLLVAGGGLMLRSFRKLVSVDTGVRADHVITMDVHLSRQVCNNQNFDTTCRLISRDVLDSVRSLPGVQQAALSEGVLRGGEVITSFRYPGGDPDPGLYVEGHPENLLTSGVVYERGVAPSFFSALGIRFLKGRNFGGSDPHDVAVLSESFARKFISGNPIGLRFTDRKDRSGQPIWLQVIGLVNDAHDHALNPYRELDSPVYYVPLVSGYDRWTIIARTSANPTAIVPAIVRIIRWEDRDAEIADIKTMEEIIAASAANPRFQAVLLGSFGALGLLLALIGIYGVISYSVAQRTHEIGVRMALGAQRGNVLGMVIREGMVLAGIGIVLGIGGALALTRYLRSLLFEITPTDPATYAAAALLLAGVALLACYVPARGATRVDPLTALRHE